MVPMPLHNYEDLPRRDIEPWCEYFKRLSGVDKTDVFRRIWEGLNEAEREAVVQDLKLFITAAHLGTDESTSPLVPDVDSEDDDEEEQEDGSEKV